MEFPARESWVTKALKGFLERRKRGEYTHWRHGGFRTSKVMAVIAEE